MRNNVAVVFLLAAAVLLAWSLAAPWGAATSPALSYRFGVRGVARISNSSAADSAQERCNWLGRTPASFCKTEQPAHLLAVRIAALLLAVAMVLALAGTLPTTPRRTLGIAAAVLSAAAILLLRWAFVGLLVIARDLVMTYDGSGRNAAIAAAALSFLAALIRARTSPLTASSRP